jgi:hypothetical protein
MKAILACVALLVALVALLPATDADFLPRPLDVEHRAKNVPSLPLLAQVPLPCPLPPSLFSRY